MPASPRPGRRPARPAAGEAVKVVVDLCPDMADLFGIRTERFWATCLPDGHFRIDNLPWWARDLAHSDVVAGEFHGHELIGARVVKIFRMSHRVRPSGWRSLAGMYSAPTCVARLSAARAELMALGAEIESRTWLYFAIGVPPGVYAGPIEAALEREEGRGDFEWVALADD